MIFTDLPEIRTRYTGQAGSLANEFYIPVLQCAVRYDRQAGYFDSAGLVQIAAGLAGFIENNKGVRDPKRPPMRVVAGATWTLDDAEAYRKGRRALEEKLNETMLRHFEPSDEQCEKLGLPKGWRPEADQIARHRFGALAWMAATGLLEIRVAFPLDPSGNPYAPGRGGAIYHPKSGVLTDGAGKSVFFVGSANETGAAWARNREKIYVMRSWESYSAAENIRSEVEEFETVWNGDDSQLLVVGLPKAVHDYLVRFVPEDGPPKYDPMDKKAALKPFPESVRAEAKRLLEAPRMPGGESLVLSPLWADGKPFKTYPHQKKVAAKVVEEHPASFIFSDEVGLGKTIEAAVALRHLVIAKKARRVLIVAPRGLVRQWLEELREKAALTAWFFDGSSLRDAGGRIRPAVRPLEEDGILVVSRHWIARSDRRREALSVCEPWDVVIVDEAHAARRKVFDSNSPNLLLGLLRDWKRRGLARCFWLLTATPMQLAATEVHDLLMLCGLDDPRWKEWSSALEFEGFFAKLRSFATEPPVRKSLVEMARTSVEMGAADLDPARPPAECWDRFDWKNMVKATKKGTALSLRLKNLTGERASALAYALSRQTPLSVYMFRHTRTTLRAYQEKGMVQGLAKRVPEDAPVDFSDERERELYAKIDDFCRDFYRLADVPAEQRAGLGFLMAVFRKRLSSSFEAFKKSLARRKSLIEAVQRQIDDDEAFRRKNDYNDDDETDEDRDAVEIFDEERRRLARLQDDPEKRERLEKEREGLREYIGKLGQISKDAKFAAFKKKLSQLLDERRRVIVFTQYLDTLDFIKRKLESAFGSKMGCYSGRGGEIWDPATARWKTVEKAEIKNRCRKDHPMALKVLLGTDAASEGLNLQQFSALINYDLPWNPMRVEQRIGRIDRIGQESSDVKIVNLYIRGTIEEDAYITLKHRIGAFEEVVGPLQPILAEMPRILRKVATGELELEQARKMLDDAARKERPPVADAFELPSADIEADFDQKTPSIQPATQKQLAAFCLAHPAPGMSMSTVPEPGEETVAAYGTQACLSINWPDVPPETGISPVETILATFSGELADRCPPTAPTRDPEGNLVEGGEGEASNMGRYVLGSLAWGHFMRI